MGARISAGVLVLLLASPAWGQTRVLELEPLRIAGWLAVDVVAAELLDERTRSTVESGLPGSCELRVALEREGHGPVGERRVRRELELDLWEGSVWLREEGREERFASLAAADSAWSRFEALRLLPLERLRQGERYRVVVRLDVRPLGRAERERVSRWVSRRADADRRETSFDLGGLLRRFVSGGEEEEVDALRRTPWIRAEELAAPGGGR